MHIAAWIERATDAASAASTASRADLSPRDGDIEVVLFAPQRRLRPNCPFFELAVAFATQEERDLSETAVDGRAAAVDLLLVLPVERVGDSEHGREPSDLPAGFFGQLAVAGMRRIGRPFAMIASDVG